MVVPGTHKGFAGGVNALVYSRTDAQVQILGGFGAGLSGRTPLFSSPPWDVHLWPKQ
jgi:hypothetical protein